jgi:LytR cell envelope-related transcriptional attenuator
MNEGAFRGVLLVAVAVVIGALLLANGFDDTGVVSDSSDDDGGDTTTTLPDTETPDGGVNPAEIPVVVANGAGIEGAAAAVTELLVTLGYNPGSPVDATNPDPSGLDTVYYVTAPRDFQPEALQTASDLGLTPEAVQPLPDPPPANPGLAGVVVVLGVNGTLAPTATGTATTTPG